MRMLERGGFRLVLALGSALVATACGGGTATLEEGSGSGPNTTEQSPLVAQTTALPAGPPLDLVLEADRSFVETVADLVAQSELVVIGRASGWDLLEDFSDPFSAVVLHSLDLSETIVGTAPPGEIKIVTVGANVTNPQVQAAFEAGGSIALVTGGFGGLPLATDLLLFLQRPVTRFVASASAHVYEITGSVQGLRIIGENGQLLSFGSQHVVGQDAALISDLVTVSVAEVPEIPGLNDGTPVADAREQVAAIAEVVGSRGVPTLNHNITIDVSPGEEPDSDSLVVTLSEGSPNNEVYAGVCDSDTAGIAGCQIDTFRLVTLDATGSAEFTLPRGSFQPIDDQDRCSEGCRLVVASRQEEYGSEPIPAP